MNVSLVVFTPNRGAKTINLRAGRYVIGRKDTASLRIALPQVSREHCELVLEGDTLTVRDLKSSNGTFKNNKRIETGSLEAGDYLGVGPIVMGVQINGRPAKIEPPAPEKIGADFAALAETPPAGSPAQRGPGKAAGQPTGSAADDPDKTVTSRASSSSIKGSLSSDDSSVFDFDFDFENDEKPKR